MTDSPDYAQLEDWVHAALKQWRSGHDTQPVLAELCLYQRAVRDMQQRASAGNVDSAAADAQLLDEGLAELAGQFPDEERLLRLRYEQGLSVRETAAQLNLAESTFYTHRRAALRRLARTVQRMEEECRAAPPAAWGRHLPAPTYTRLVGVADIVEQLMPPLLNAGPPWLLSIEGIGGIGKTALAHHLTRREEMIGRFADCAWISAQPDFLDLSGAIRRAHQPVLSTAKLVEALLTQLLPDKVAYLTADESRALAALREHLNAEPHLLVIDNLETVADLEALFPLLRRLANPCKVLLTTRNSSYGEPSLFHFPIPELNKDHALALLRQEARLSNLPALAVADDADLAPIHATVGGNPLALRLIVGQLHMDSPDAILHDLTEARGGTAENLYTYIYWRAWERLDPLSRQVLIAMPLVGVHGDDLAFLAATTGMAQDDLRAGLKTLMTLNLVDGVGGPFDRRYRIHSLTRTFLHKQVVKWQT